MAIMFCKLQATLYLVLAVLSSRSEADSTQCTCQKPLSCPIYWTIWRDNCYRYFGSEVSWSDAHHYCRMFSAEDDENKEDTANLVSIHSQDEQDFIYHYWKSLREVDTRNKKPGMWIGLHDYQENGVHVWTDSSAVDYTNFDFGQEAVEGQHYYFLGDWNDEDSIPHGKWHDFYDRPDWYFKFMCKMPARPSVV